MWTRPAVPYHPSELARVARMHKAISLLMFKLECQVIDRNPDFELGEREFLRRIDYNTRTVLIEGKRYPMLDMDFPTVDPSDPARLTASEQQVMNNIVPKLYPERAAAAGMFVSCMPRAASIILKTTI